MELKKGNLRVSFVQLGEGWGGDYDPDDPDDEELLRLDFHRLVDGEWEEIASYCTAMPVKVGPNYQWAALRHAMSEVYGHNDGFIDHMGQQLSWMKPSDFDRELSMWTNTETEVLYYWLLRDKRLVNRLELFQWQVEHKRATLEQAAELLQISVMARINAWHNNKSKGRIGYTVAIRNMYAVVFYPNPKQVEKKIQWAEILRNHSEQLAERYLDESGEVSL